MKNITIILVFIFLNSCSSSKMSTQTNTQDKPAITNSEVTHTVPVKDESTIIVEKSQTKDTHLVVLTDATDIKKGEELFTNKTCTACHFNDGGGSIGPNLTDAFTISGCSFEDIFNVISKGGRPGKGMIAWEQYLSEKEIQQLTSYIVTLQGTTPEEPKRPEGEPCSK